MAEVHVNLGERSYEIAIGTGILDRAADAAAGASRIMVVTDTNVEPLYGDRLREQLSSHAAVSTAVVPAGEGSKSFAQLERLLSLAVQNGLDRRSRVIALGGGVVGDLAGFMAACFMRGITYVQVPTTLLAMVDSAVGGKTAVNIPEGKNLVGAFWQPAAVIADMDTLRTLPDREYRAGLAEVIKYGVIWDAPFFSELESRVEALNARDAGFLSEVVCRCCEIKADVVAMDEKEGGVRAILNFGHTLAHALEQSAGYGEWLHGEAVAVGMVYAAQVGTRVSGFDAADARRLTSLLAAVGLPTAISGVSFDWTVLRRVMGADKKASASVPKFVLPRRFGDVVFGVEVDDSVLQACYGVVQAERG